MDEAVGGQSRSAMAMQRSTSGEDLEVVLLETVLDEEKGKA